MYLCEGLFLQESVANWCPLIRVRTPEEAPRFKQAGEPTVSRAKQAAPQSTGLYDVDLNIGWLHYNKCQLKQLRVECHLQTYFSQESGHLLDT